MGQIPLRSTELLEKLNQLRNKLTFIKVIFSFRDNDKVSGIQMSTLRLISSKIWNQILQMD